MADDKRLSELIQRTPNGQEYFEVIIPPFTPGTNRKVLLSDLAAILGGSVPDADATTKGILEVAAMSEIVAGTDVGGTGAALSVLPSQLGITRTVTGAGANAQTDHNGLIIFDSATPFNFTLDQFLAKTKTSFVNYGAGAVTFIAGSGVTITGTVVLPGAVGAVYPSCFIIYDTLTTPRVVIGIALKSIGIECSNQTTPISAGTAKKTFRMPHAMTLTAVRASLSTAQASGSIFTVGINEGGTTILSTKLTIDNTEKTSTTAATPAVISDTALADDAEITIDVDQIGNGSAIGLVVWLIGI